MKPSGSAVASSIALILENTCWTVISPWRECDFYFLFFFHATHSVFFLHREITNSLKLSTQLSLQECTVSEPCRLLDIFFFSPSAFSSYLQFYLYILLFCLLIPLAVTAASWTNASDRALHILPWTPGQVPQQRTPFLWAAYIRCWSDILHKTCHCSDINIFFFLNG